MQAKSRTQKLLLELRSDFNIYAPRCLKIRTKGGTIVPFELNRAQQHVHAILEEQKQRTGMVRAIVLKGRQQGMSTYIGGRYYWKATGKEGGVIMILTHEVKATDNLFSMVKRFHQHCPEVVRPHTGSDASKTLYFDKLDTRYLVATAGSKDTGRSQTAQLFHGSEVAFWDYAQDHLAGLGQAIPREPGTEIILESTANGIANVFHEMWTLAETGKSDFVPVFIPWFWQPEYYIKPNSKMNLSPDEEDYKEAFDLNDGQMLWRRRKIDNDFRGDIYLFDQEYPGTPSMAFRASAANTLIDPKLAERAAKQKEIEAYGAKVIGVDPSEYGDDETVVQLRQGRVAYSQIVMPGHVRPMEIVGVVARQIEEFKPDMVFVDANGLGAGVYDRLVELGYQNVVRVMSGSRSARDEIWRNKNAEMYDNMKEWLQDQPCLIPNDPALKKQLSSVTYTYDSSRRLMLTSKEKMKEQGLPSPDRADALALTFAYPVVPRERKTDKWRRRLRHRTTQGGHMSA